MTREERALEQQFAALEADSGVDDELEAMKASMLPGTGTETPQLEGADAASAPKDDVIDAELDELRSQLDK